MNVLILGGDGFIGSHLADLLEKYHNVYVVDKEDLRTTRSSRILRFYDLSKNTYNVTQQLVIEFKADVVFNCVAVATPHYYVTNPVDTFDLDFLINYEIIKALIDFRVPYIHFSTSEVYGKKWNGIYKEDESDLIIGPVHKTRWIYATSKILLEQLIIAHGGEYSIIRPQNFCGWDMDWLPDINDNVDRKWKPRLPACMLNNLFMNKPLQVVKPGTQQRCYTHIYDGVQGIKAVMDNWDKCSGHVFNIGNPQNESSIAAIAMKIQAKWNELSDTPNKHNIEKVSGNDFYGPGYEDCERRLFDDNKIYSKTGWFAKIGLDETIHLLVKEAIDNYGKGT